MTDDKETDFVDGVECIKGTDIPVDSIGAAMRGVGEDDDSEETPILTNNEYYILESEILKDNGLVEPEIPDDDASPDDIEEWHKRMKTFTENKIRLCKDIRHRRQLGCYKVSNGEAEGDSELPLEWSQELMYLKD